MFNTVSFYKYLINTYYVPVYLIYRRKTSKTKQKIHTRIRDKKAREKNSI